MSFQFILISVTDPVHPPQHDVDDANDINQSQELIHSVEDSPDMTLDNSSSDIIPDSSTPLIDMSQDFIDGDER